ncbi:DUF2868 domain-containing protein [Desulforhopalus sp. 52FAK]
MKTAHSIDQIIDLEYFLHEDATKSPEELHLRDREIGLQLTSDSSEQPTKSELISGWTLSRRNDLFSEKNLDSPGTIFLKSRSLASTLTIVKGLLAGLFTGFAFFAYAGTTPINVLEFLIFFVFSQIFIVLLLLLGLLARRVVPALKLPSSSFYMLYTMGKKTFVFIHKKWLSNFPREKHDSLRHAFGVIQRNHRLYGSLFYWVLFSLAQLFGIAFNIGLLGSSFLKIITSDLAFGWQSTLQFTSSAINNMVQFLATPWTWLLPEGVGTPTLLQIEGSHIILKDGIYHLTTADLIAWWPFLLLCLLVYGLLTRLLFYICGRLMEHYSLSQVQFQSPESRALIRRMSTPVITTQAEPEVDSRESIQNSSVCIENETNEEIPEPQVLLIPGELHDSFPDTEFDTMLRLKGLEAIEQYDFMLGYDEDLEILAQLAKRHWTNGEGIFIIMESWMVPLVSFLVFLRELRKISDPMTNIEIGLTGKSTETCFASVQASDMDIWRKKIESLGDPYIQVLPITGIRK